ncbi:MAG: hypothetical protein ABR549_09805 [Mycobacteriales bacterium]
MNENEIYPEDPNDVTDIDDVEGHGLKEVAAGLGAAAVLAGGAAGATQLASTSATVHPSTGGSSITVTVDDPLETADHITDNAISAIQHQRDAAESLAINQVAKTDQRIADVKAAAGSALNTADAIVDNTTAWASDVKQSVANTAGAEVRSVRGVAAAEVSSASTLAGKATTLADKKVDAAKTTASSTVRDADRKVATILSVATTTAANGVHTAQITLNAVDAGAGASTNQAGGWVLVKAGDNVLAQVQMNGGTATATWTMPLVGGHSVQISYTGDNVFAPSLRAVTL